MPFVEHARDACGILRNQLCDLPINHVALATHRQYPEVSR